MTGPQRSRSSSAIAPGSFDAGRPSRTILLSASTGGATSWNPNANGAVLALAVNGATVYLGGDFTTVSTQTRNHIAAVSVAGGSATTWNPDANGSLWALAVSGTTVYVGGLFTGVNSKIRNYIAALDATAGAATAWNPNADARVTSLAVSGSTVHVGGEFSVIGGQPRSFIAALDATTGAAVQPRNHIAAIDATTGLATAWDPNADSDVWSLAVSGSTVYAGGAFSSIGVQPRNHIAAIGASTGIATAWNPNAEAFPETSVDVLVASGATVYAGGTFTSMSGRPQPFLAALSEDEGTVDVPVAPLTARFGLTSASNPARGVSPSASRFIRRAP